MIKFKNLFLTMIMIIFILNFSSCDFIENVEEFNTANSAIHNLYAANNSEKPIDDVKLDMDSYGLFSGIVKLEKEYLKSRISKEKEFIDLEEKINNYDVNKGNEKEYKNLTTEYFEMEESLYQFENDSDKKLVADIKALKIDSDLVDDYIKETEERINFEAKYREKLHKIGKDIALKTKEQANHIYSTSDEDSNIVDKLNDDIEKLSTEFNKINEEFNVKVNERMNTKEEKQKDK